jgi:phage terminase large subunit
MWRSRAFVVLLAGPAGTGKTRANLEKVYRCCQKYPGCRWLIMRKTRRSLTETALVTLEELVIPSGDPVLRGPKRQQRSTYRFDNGSLIVLAGYDEPQKLYSSEYDGIYIPEANEISEGEFEQLFRAMRWNGMPYRQILLDCNPQGPTHWLKRWADGGRLQFLNSKHEDNPRWFDSKTKDWTPDGKVYLENLDRLTGVRYLRLRKGLWVQAEGVVYEWYDPGIHLINRFEIPQSWTRYKVVDFGYTNPFVCQWWAEDHDGRLYRYREIYMTGKLVEDHARQIKEIDRINKEPQARVVICDHDAEDRATLERHLIRGTTPAKKDVSPGIQAVQSRMRVQGDNKPRIFLLRDSLVQRDPDLAEKKKPTCTEEEIENYRWDERSELKKEVPVKEDDHGVDAMRYMVFWLDDRLTIGKMPNQPDGSKNVVQKTPSLDSAAPAGEIVKRKW